jgi:NADH-quinone oxidoreductase subunit E
MSPGNRPKFPLLNAVRRLFRGKPAAPADRAGIDLTALDAMIAKHKGKGRVLIELLQEVSEHYRYLPPEALQHISTAMEVPLSRLYSLATFYQDFKLKPQGRHRLVICTGTACHVKGAAAIVDVLCRELNLKPGETTRDGKLTLATVNCIGLCGVGPVAMLDGQYHSQLTADKALELVKRI